MTNLRDILSNPQFPAGVERLEANAWIEASKARAPGRLLETQAIDGTVLIVDHSAAQPVSRAFLLGIDHPVSSPLLQSIIEAFATAGIDAFSAGLLPVARPTHAPRLLEQAGFTRGPQQVAVVRPVGEIEPADQFFRIRLASASDAANVEDLMIRTTGDPTDWTQTFSNLIAGNNWRAHLAFEGSRLYAMGGFFYSGETALLFNSSWVLTGYESRGVETALIQTAVRDAESLGCRWVVSVYPDTAETRMRRFQRMGFEVAFQRRVYFHGPEPRPNELGDPLSRGALR